MLKTTGAVLLSLLAINVADAAADDLIRRAVNCELREQELASFAKDLANSAPEFKEPSQQYGAPSADVYQLASPVASYGFSATQVVVTPARVLIAVSGKNVQDAVKALALEESRFAPASRAIRPNVSVVAFQMSHEAIRGKLLVGCEYASPAAAKWLEKN